MPHRLSNAAAIALIFLGAAPAIAAESDPCRIMAPRYEPKSARSSETQPARWLGGARLNRPVAQPCPPSRRAADA